MKKLFGLVLFLLCFVANSFAMTFSTTSKTEQTVERGSAIEPIVYQFTDIKLVETTGVPVGIKDTLDAKNNTYTLLGTVSANKGTYKYTIEVTDVEDQVTTYTGTITVTEAEKPVVSTFTLTTNNAVQSVVAGQAIDPVVYSFDNIKGVSTKGLPKGLSTAMDKDSKTFTISGTIDASSATFDYDYTVEVTISEGNVENYTGTFKVTAAAASPGEKSFVLTTNNSVQSVVAGQAIEPIVYSFGNIKNIAAKGVPKGLGGAMDQTKKTYTISGAVDASSATADYEYAIEVTFADGGISKYTGTIKVTAASAASSSSGENGGSSGSVATGSSSSGSVEPPSSSSDSEAILANYGTSKFNVNVVGRQVTVLGLAAGSKVAVLDLQGSVVSSGIVAAESASLVMPRAGMYIVRVDKQIQKISVR